MGAQENRGMASRETSVEKLACAEYSGTSAQPHGLVERGRTRRAVESYTEPFAKVEEPNDLWCVDFKGQFNRRASGRWEPQERAGVASRQDSATQSCQ